MLDCDDWSMPAHFTSLEDEAQHVRASVGLADVSWMAKLDVKGAESQIANCRSAAEIPLSRDKLRIENWTLARGHRLITCEPHEREAVTHELHRLASLHPCFHVTDVTSVYTALLLAGPRSGDVMSKLSSLNMSDAALLNRSSAQTALAHVHAIVLRQDLGPVLAYRLLVGREVGEYVWEAAMHAGHEFGIVPFGLTALTMLSE